MASAPISHGGFALEAAERVQAHTDDGNVVASHVLSFPVVAALLSGSLVYNTVTITVDRAGWATPWR